MTSLHLVPYKYLKKLIKSFPICHNASETFMLLCRPTISNMYAIFNTVHSITYMNHICEFQAIRRIFTRFRAGTDRETDKLNA